MRKKRYMDTSYFICPECKNAFPIMRDRGCKRKSGHIKDIWCPFCKETKKFLEIKYGECGIIKGRIIY